MPLSCGTHPVPAQWPNGLFAQILERHLDPVIIKFLVIGSELISAACTAVEELTHDPDGGVRLALKSRRVAYVDRAV